MTEALGFGFLAAFALGGWALTLGMVTRGVVPMANALKIMQAIVQREDDKVFSLTERAMKLRNRGAPAPKEEVARPTGGGPMAEAMQAGSVGHSFIDEQPESGMDIVE